MKEPDIRKWHRRTAIVIAPLLVAQAVSGIFLSVDGLLGFHRHVGETIKENIPPLTRFWNMILVEIHYGLRVGGAFYHILLGIGAVGVAVSGFMIFLKIREREKQPMDLQKQRVYGVNAAWSGKPAKTRTNVRGMGERVGRQNKPL